MDKTDKVRKERERKRRYEFWKQKEPREQEKAFHVQHELTFKNITECIDSEGNTYEQSKDLFR